MRRTLRIGAGLGLALVIITCTDQSVTGPKDPGRAALDLRALASVAPGAPVIPIDSLEITFRRADGSVALDTRLGFHPDTLVSDSAIIRLNVDLQQNNETFSVVVRAFGAGVDWYRYTGSVQVAAGGVAQPALTGLYVGTGANAVRVQMRPADTTVIGGTAFALRALAYGAAGDSIVGVPIGYRLSDTTRGKVTYPSGTTATLTAALSVRDSVWVVAETPTHLKDSTRVHVLPPAVKLLLQSGDKQTSVLNAALPAPLVVRVIDGLNGGFKGDTVHWTVTAGTATLKAPVSVSDTAGYAVMAVTPLALGPLTVQAAVPGLQGSPVSFSASAVTGTIKQIAISPKIDTIGYGTTVQYAAIAKDSLGNLVTTTFGWTSTVPTIAGVSSSGLATALAGDSTKIIASAGGVADTARLYVRVLRTLTVKPADTVITAVGDSVQLRTTALDNFGAPVTTGLKIKFISASPPTIVKVDTTGKAKLLGPGNAVILAVDTVAPTIVLQASATLRVNQVTFALSTKPKVDTVGVGGQSQLIATALDSNGYAIPGKSLSWATRLGVTGLSIANVSPTGLVSGVALGSTYAIDSLVEGLKVFKDSAAVVVTAAAPKLLQWAFDSTAVGNGGSVSIGLALTTPSATPLTVSIASSDSTVAKANPNTVTIPAGTSATSATIYGLRAGRVVLTATDASGLYTAKQMVVTVVSTITFREIASPCCQQPYFYLNQTETHKAQVWLSDPAPAGGLGITFVYGRGLTAVTPSPALIPAGQLSADVVFQGLQPGTLPDSVVPTSGGYIGKFSYAYVAADSLRLSASYPYTGVVGVGQVLQLSLAIPYAMDHALIVANQLSSPKGTTPTADTIPVSATSRIVNVVATALGKDTLTVSAGAWVPASAPLIVSTPHLGVSGTTGMVAGDPSHGYWTASPQDSTHYGHAVVDTLRATLVSRDTTVVAVDSPAVKVLPGSQSAALYGALRAQPSAGGKSVWLVASAPGYTPDSFQVSVTQPVLTMALGYPSDGRVAAGTFFQNAGYVSIPYVRPDTFWVVFGHTRKGVVNGPDSVAIVKGQTYGYFNTRGDTLGGTDTMRVARATGYVVPPLVVFHVDSIHVRPYSYPAGPLYTISPPQLASAYAYDSVNGQARPLVAPLRVTLSSSDTTAFKFDSAAVTIPASAFSSNADTLRVKGASPLGAYIRTTAPGSTPDSVGPIKVLATPLALNFGYPYNGYVGRGLSLSGNYVSIPAAALTPLTVALQRYAPAKDSLGVSSVVIPQGATTSASFDVLGLDSTGTDSITATATGFVTARQTVHDTAAALLLQSISTSHLTSEPPQYVTAYTRTRTGSSQNVINPVTVAIRSSDSTVIQVDSTRVRRDSGTATVPANQATAVFKISYVGSGTARLRISAPGFDADSSALISVTGPSLHLAYPTVTTGLNQIFQNEYVYLDNAVTGNPLVVTLQRSDSLAASPIFGLSTTSVTIPVGSTSSPAFEITGQNLQSALLIARAAGYSQAGATVAVGQPRLAGSATTLSLYVGAPPTSFTLYTEDQTGATRIVNPAISIADASTAPTVAVADSATFPIPLRTYYNSVGLRGIQKGSAALTFSSPTYTSDTLQVSVDTATLVLNTAPNGLGTGQTAQMAVSIPFTAGTAVTVSLTASPAGVLGVPTTVTIPANASSAAFTVTGVSQGTANVGATAPGFYQAALLPVTVGAPKLALGVPASLVVGQKSTITVYAQDANGTSRNVAQPLVVALTSSRPSHTSFDSSSITIPAGSYYAQTGVTLDSAGAYTFSASAPTYAGANQNTTATGALVTMVAPTSFSPLVVTIASGQSVTWKNTDAIAHTTTSDATPTPIWNSGSLAPGATYGPVYFPTAGTYTYHCTIHGATMSGTIVVQ